MLAKIVGSNPSQDPSEGPGLGDREVAATVDFAERVSRRLADIADTVAGPAQRSLSE